MSSPEDSRGDGTPHAERDAFERLDAAVRDAVGRIGELEGALDAARAEASDLRDLLRDFEEGDEDPVEMKARLKRLEGENADMRRRLDEGRGMVERLLAKIRFLEEQR